MDERAVTKTLDVTFSPPSLESSEVTDLQVIGNIPVSAGANTAEVESLTLTYTYSNSINDKITGSVVATALDKNKSPVPGVVITFSATNGATLAQLNATTDSEGKAISRLSGNNGSTTTLTATVPNLLTLTTGRDNKAEIFTNLTDKTQRTLSYNGDLLSKVKMSEYTNAWVIKFKQLSSAANSTRGYTYLYSVITPKNVMRIYYLLFPGLKIPERIISKSVIDIIDDIAYMKNRLPVINYIIERQIMTSTTGTVKTLDGKMIRFTYSQLADPYFFILTSGNLLPGNYNFMGYAGKSTVDRTNPDYISTVAPDYQYAINCNEFYARYPGDPVTGYYSSRISVNTTFVFDKFHRIHTFQRSFSSPDLLSRLGEIVTTKQREIYTYGNSDLNKPIREQRPIFDLPTQVESSWEKYEGPRLLAERRLTSAMRYDDSGNVIWQTNNDGTVETFDWYPSGGGSGKCPAEPNGFVRFLKKHSLQSAPSDDYGKIIRESSLTWSEFSTRKLNSNIFDKFVALSTNIMSDGVTQQSYTKMEMNYDTSDVNAPFYSAIKQEVFSTADTSKTGWSMFSTTDYTRELNADSLTFKVTVEQNTSDGLIQKYINTYNALSLQTEQYTDSLGNVTDYLYGNTDLTQQ
ncbi:TPA: Ig-like domain-containing protein [Enterobacter hormaechei subsp. xiangfangensis]|nr:Ig-like domain-containing protein [Enterobacter hormaechei subsp. xiangfangensis]